ncbi:MAG: HAMP domain-containing histidine kinase, partial [Lachnospiraceae bacterium]|nr:HAMP domain-containing histidine kinase [Lachnospiraceae bacterium]
TSLVARPLLVDMFVAVLIILIFTALMLTRWIHKGVFGPINQLNVAMKKIKDGNFDYMLFTDSKDEIGDLYRNYEDMRLRLKESTEEKMVQEKQNKELISNISHDLKTPITAIKGYMEGIMDGVADTPEKMDKYIKTVYNKANDMDKLINELTLYSGIDNNRIPYNFHRINVADYFGDCVEEVGLDLESKNIELNYSNLAAPDTMIIADPEQMKKVINNIIGNSIKYIDKEKGVIDIRILDEVDSVRIEIEDNGKGIAAKDLPKIFERFYRTDASRNSSKGGSGIGLSIVKKIVEDHGGYIWATSREGEGTCMHFVIRKYKEQRAEAD